MNFKSYFVLVIISIVNLSCTTPKQYHISQTHTLDPSNVSIFISLKFQNSISQARRTKMRAFAEETLISYGYSPRKNGLHYLEQCSLSCEVTDSRSTCELFDSKGNVAAYSLGDPWSSAYGKKQQVLRILTLGFSQLFLTGDDSALKGLESAVSFLKYIPNSPKSTDTFEFDVTGFDDGVHEGAKIDYDQAISDAYEKAAQITGVNIMTEHRSRSSVTNGSLTEHETEEKAVSFAATIEPGFKVKSIGYDNGFYKVRIKGNVFKKVR